MALFMDNISSRTHLLRVVAGCSLGLTIVVGCRGRGPERVAVAGAVTYQSQTVAEGTICFIPADGTSGSSTMAAISDGQYKTDSSGGLPIGTYRVDVRAFRDSSRDARNAALGPRGAELRRVQYLPAKYNAKTELKITLASGQSSARHDFALAE